MCYSRQRRATKSPELKESELETARNWKKRHIKYWKNYIPRESQFLPTIAIFCWYCAIELVKDDATGLCGFCKEELPACTILMAYEFPASEIGWRTYFDTLTNANLLELEEKIKLEKIHRLGIWAEERISRQEQLYGKHPPDHHQRQMRLFREYA